MGQRTTLEMTSSVTEECWAAAPLTKMVRSHPIISHLVALRQCLPTLTHLAGAG